MWTLLRLRCKLAELRLGEKGSFQLNGNVLTG